MGIDVAETGIVSFSQSHNHRINTRSGVPPIVSRVGSLVVHSLLRRTKDGDRLNDGNPLVYALKRLNGYNIRFSDIKIFHSLVDQKIKMLNIQSIDIVVPVPSGYCVASGTARRFINASGSNAYIDNLLTKVTVLQVLNSMPSKSSVRKHDQSALIAQRKRFQSMAQNSLVKMKDVDVKARKFVLPFMPSGNIFLNGENVLLVDDLLSTGASLRCADSQLRKIGAGNVIGLTLFSGL